MEFTVLSWRSFLDVPIVVVFLFHLFHEMLPQLVSNGLSAVCNGITGVIGLLLTLQHLSLNLINHTFVRFLNVLFLFAGLFGICRSPQSSLLLAVLLLHP
jgi:hypothetical protein